ncbi:MAG: manganese efflux pump MntP family protein [Acholeplasmatales bacterium]|jgi:putative Mn2+ efflux pump MntP|nr:manganese efflux pump MntP family protein [Acholeplasmatales bacterium]
MILMNVGKIIATGLLLGLGLTMDACAVSMANGLEEPKMKLSKMTFIALMFAIFQAFMPLIGYAFGAALYQNVPFIEKYKIIPILALIILMCLGLHMIIEGIKESKETPKERDSKIEALGKKLTFKLIFIQAIATSIDALSTGLTFSDYSIINAILVVSLIALVTFIFSFVSLMLGKKFGTWLGNKAIIVGGIILCFIGIEIFISGVFF